MSWQQAALAVFVGAVIGYVTNWIAIRMLFRPRHEIRILGRPLPFTPGVIPRGKKRLAGSVGDVVGGMLLTGENVTRHLLQSGVEEQVRGRVNARLAEIKEQGTTLGDFLGGRGGEAAARRLRDEAAGLLAGAAGGLLASPELRRPLARLAAHAVWGLLDRPVGPVAGTPEFAELRAALGRLPAKILDRDDVAGELRDRLAYKIENFLGSPKPVAAYVPDAVREGLHQLISDQTPRLVAALQQYLESPGARRAIRNRVEDFFEGTALKKLLNGMFMLAGSGPDAIVQRLAGEISSFLAEEKNRAELEGRLHILVDEALAKSVAETTAALDTAGRREKAGEIAGWLLERLRQPELMEPLLDALEEILAANSRRTWRELFSLDGTELAVKLEDWLDRLLESASRQEAGKRFMEQLAHRVVDGLWSAPVGRLLDLLPPEQAANPGALVLTLYRYAVREHLPGLLSFFDVSGMVRQRVEELDVLQVEEMVLGIVRRELTAITWLGALLGAFLGAAMVALQYMMR